MNRQISTLEAFLEYAHKLPWGRENQTAAQHLGAALQSIAADTADVPSPDPTGDGGQV